MQDTITTYYINELKKQNADVNLIGKTGGSIAVVDTKDETGSLRGINLHLQSFAHGGDGQYLAAKLAGR